jgi:hypothetical protein
MTRKGEVVVNLTLLAIFLATGLGALAPRVAAACGATPTPYATLAESLPPVRTGLPRDGAVVIRGKLWGPSAGPSTFANVRLFDEAGTPISVTSVAWYSAEPSQAYAWVAPLPAGTKIGVEAVVPEGAVKPVDAEGPTTTTFIVETGDHTAAPLVLAGPLRVQLEAFDADIIQCSAPCGGTCSTLGQRRALRARIVVPAMTGGVDFDGYRGWLHLTDDQAATFNGAGEGAHGSGNVNLPHWMDVRPGVETEVLQEIPDADRPYAPCFALNLWDPAGHAAQSDPVCLPAIKPSAYVRKLDGDNGGGCSTAPGRGNGACLLVMCLVAVSLWRRPRSQRSSGS